MILFLLLLHHIRLICQTNTKSCWFARDLAFDLSRVLQTTPATPATPARSTAGVAGEGGGEDAEDQLQEATEGEEENEDAGSVSDNIEGGQDYKDCARQRGEE